MELFPLEARKRFGARMFGISYLLRRTGQSSTTVLLNRSVLACPAIAQSDGGRESNPGSRSKRRIHNEECTTGLPNGASSSLSVLRSAFIVHRLGKAGRYKLAAPVSKTGSVTTEVGALPTPSANTQPMEFLWKTETMHFVQALFHVLSFVGCMASRTETRANQPQRKSTI